MSHGPEEWLTHLPLGNGVRLFMHVCFLVCMCVCVLTMGNWAGRTGSLNKDYAEDKAWGEQGVPPCSL